MARKPRVICICEGDYESRADFLLMYKNATKLLLSSMIRYGGQLGIFILLARLYGPAPAGLYAFAVAVTAPAFILASLGMRDIYLTLRTHVALAEYERVRAATVLAAIVISVAISLLFPLHTAIIVAIVASGKALDSFRDLYGAALQKASRIGVSIQTSVVVAILQVATLAVAIVLGASMPMALSISTLVYLLVVVFVMRPITVRVSLEHQPTAAPAAGKKPWVEILKVGFPMGVSYGLLTLLSTLPQYFLSWSWGAVVVGKYATILYLVVAMEMALNALAQAWIPVGRTLELKGLLSSRRIFEVAARWTLITLPCALVGIGIAAVSFPRVFGPAYTISWAEVLPLAIAMFLTPSVFAATTLLAIQNRYNSALISSMLTVLIGFGFGMALIRPFGIAGALWTFAACLVVRAGASLAFTKHEPSASHSRTPEVEVL